MTEFNEKLENGEMSDNELEAVAGGKKIIEITYYCANCKAWVKGDQVETVDGVVLHLPCGSKITKQTSVKKLTVGP